MKPWGVGTSLVGAVILLLTGIHLGFAVAPWAAVYPWGVFTWILGALVGWGWRIRGVVPLLIFGWGLVSAARVEAVRQSALSLHWQSGMGAQAPEVSLLVESEVDSRVNKQGGMSACFQSHLGPTPLWVILPLAEGVQHPQLGETVRCRGWVSRKVPKEGLFARRIFWGQEMQGVVSPSPAGTRLLSKLAAACAARAALGLSWCSEWATLNRAILLGQRAALSPQQRKVFVAAGTIHVFAISGLHVMLVALLLVRVGGALRLSLPLRGVLALPPLALYVLLTGARPSAMRAALMAGFYLMAPAVGRRGDSLAAWSLTALGVYGWTPERVFDIGCTFSFVVMFGLVAWMRWVYSRLPELPERFQCGLWGMLGVSLAAWVAGVPVAAHLFGRLTLGGLLANLVVVNLAALTVAFGLTGIGLGFVWAPLAVLFNNLAALSTGLMEKVSLLVSLVPCGNLEIEPWPISVCLMWYLGWAIVCFLAVKLGDWQRGVWWK